nr:MAG TPA: hypothetical protein [Caudoviricetes sp.]
MAFSYAFFLSYCFKISFHSLIFSLYAISITSASSTITSFSSFP